MSKHTILVPVEVEMQGYPAAPNQYTLPAFWEEAASASGDDVPFDEIGISSINRFLFYLFTSEEEKKGPNRGYLASVNLAPAFESIAEQFGGLVERAAISVEENNSDE